MSLSDEWGPGLESQDLPFTPYSSGICSSIAVDLMITVGSPQLVAMTILCLKRKAMLQQWVSLSLLLPRPLCGLLVDVGSF